MQRYLAACVVLTAGLCAPARAQTIDRIMAVVGGEIILLSDVNAAIRFGLVEPRPGAADPVRAALDALIDRQLQLFEVNRYLPPEPEPSAIDERLTGIRQQLGGEQAVLSALAEVGMSDAQLRSRVRDNLRIASYRAQRFGAALQPSEEDLLRFYRTHEADFTKDGAPQPFEAVRGEVRARLVGERSTALINEWLDMLRRRTDLQILYAGGSPASGAAA
jgi:hypothetical protein